MNFTTKAEFERLIPEAKTLEVERNCKESLKNSFQCGICTNSLLTLRQSIRSHKIGNVSGCTGYIFIYTAALINQFGPTDLATVQCLFKLRFSPTMKKKRHTLLILGVLMGCAIGCLGAVIVVCFLKLRSKRIVKAKKGIVEIEEFCTIGIHNLLKFQYEEIKRATDDFSRGNIIGKGKYGNVFKGTLQDGTKVAIKRLKNCSIGGNETFEHELEVIASVRHFNLVELRGYCTTLAPMDGHQRLIVCDLMRNGSLYDHLFESNVKLSWPIRQKIAFGTARGLAYLHNEAQASVIHRDVKSSNILLDENFEPKMADFGLAKFRPEGMTHLSTMLAGTLGYVAPEYALYGKLTDGSDVYSFGVVLLELLSGKKAVLSMDKGKTSLLSDWAWSLVAQGRARDVVEENMPEVGLPDVMEQYVVVAVLCCHPQLYARPTMDHLVKLLENNM